MAHDSVGRELREADLGDELGRDPVGAADDVARRVLERVGLASAGIEGFLQRRCVLDVPAGADAAVIDQLAVVPGAEEQ